METVIFPSWRFLLSRGFVLFVPMLRWKKNCLTDYRYQ